MTVDVRRGSVLALVTAAALLEMTGTAQAQTLGTFNFQLQPYCNVITMTITQEGGTYRLSGWDDACGAVDRYPMSGTISANTDGTLAFGFVVTRSTGIDVHTSFRFTPAPPFSGPWSDSAGNSGTYVFNGATGGNPRPAPTSSVAVNSVTTVNIVDNSINAIDVNPAQVQLRVNGTCPAGQSMTAINQTGTVVCATTAAGAAPRTLFEDVAVVNGLTQTCEDIAALNFGTVAAGTLVCDGVVHAVFDHANLTLSRLEFDVSMTPTACAANPQAAIVEVPAAFPSAPGHDVSVPVKRAFAVAPGPLVARVNARTATLAAATELGHSVSCTFTPQ